MTLNQLHYFMEVYRQRNITRAAERLHISQPSLTTAVRKLEDELGISLFHRIRKRIEPTDNGQYYYEQLMPLLGQLDELNKEMADKGNHSNTLKIGVPPMIGSVIFPAIYKAFNTKHPTIQLEIVEAGTLKMIDYLIDDTLDLSLLLEETSPNKSIHSKVITSGSSNLYVNKEHSLANNKSLTMNELKGIPLILLNRDFVINRMVREGFSKNNLAPNIIMETTQINTIRRFISDGLASTILIDRTIEPDASIACIPIDDMPKITFTIVWKADHFLSSSARIFLNFIENHYSTPDNLPRI